ncbi:MAG: hypothetical protein ACI9NY_000728 [Kiritimatiellia bacterium]|jgi:hypothetical protein
MHNIRQTITAYRPKVCNRSCFFLVVLLVTLLSSMSVSAKRFTEMQWVDLIPSQDLEVLLNPPVSLTSIPDGSALDVLPNDVFGDSLADSVDQAISSSKAPITQEEQRYYDALQSVSIKEELRNKNIRIAGFVVPVEYGDNQVITEFFLVPYFGACIHMPAPPPNQIIYVKYSAGLTIDALYDPFWIEGQLLTAIVENDIALSAYSIKADNIKPYEEYKK